MDVQLEKVIIIIPALNPDEKMLGTIRDLKQKGFKYFVIVDDGSDAKYSAIFDRAETLGNVIVLKHNVNLGQGRAFKTAFNYYLGQVYDDAIGVVECDADGQHHPDDIVKCAELLLKYPNEFILGVRDFNAPGIPWRSRFGNKCTRAVFRFFCGMDIKDTQTGLKGIPNELIPALIEAQGERFEYATSVLLEVNKRNVPIRQFGIKTIYLDDNVSSHFDPFFDSLRIYSLLLKYILSSLSSFIIDIVIFALMTNIFKTNLANSYIFLATYTAKVFSCTYSFFVNKRIVFHNKERLLPTIGRYVLLCAISASASAIVIKQSFLLSIGTRLL